MTVGLWSEGPKGPGVMAQGMGLNLTYEGLRTRSKVQLVRLWQAWVHGPVKPSKNKMDAKIKYRNKTHLGEEASLQTNRMPKNSNLPQYNMDSNIPLNLQKKLPLK